MLQEQAGKGSSKECGDGRIIVRAEEGRRVERGRPCNLKLQSNSNEWGLAW